MIPFLAFVFTLLLILFSPSGQAVCICAGDVNGVACKQCGSSSSSSVVSYSVKSGQLLSDVAAECGVSVATIASENGLPEEAVLSTGQVLRVPGGNCGSVSGGSSIGSGTMQWPVNGRITSPFGPRKRPTAGASTNHQGLDIGAPSGTPVYAADSGKVVSASYSGGYGNLLTIDHGGGLTTRYAHLSAFKTSAGTPVSKGQVVALVGSTGHSTGPHLHFEVRINGVAQDPMNYLPK